MVDRLTGRHPTPGARDLRGTPRMLGSLGRCPRREQPDGRTDGARSGCPVRGGAGAPNAAGARGAPPSPGRRRARNARSQPNRPGAAPNVPPTNDRGFGPASGLETGARLRTTHDPSSSSSRSRAPRNRLGERRPSRRRDGGRSPTCLSGAAGRVAYARSQRIRPTRRSELAPANHQSRRPFCSKRRLCSAPPKIPARARRRRAPRATGQASVRRAR